MGTQLSWVGWKLLFWGRRPFTCWGLGPGLGHHLVTGSTYKPMVSQMAPIAPPPPLVAFLVPIRAIWGVLHHGMQKLLACSGHCALNEIRIGTPVPIQYESCTPKLRTL